MAETAPLLHRIIRNLSKSFRNWHSAGLFLGQKALLTIRATTTTYLFVFFALDMLHRITCTKHFASEASNVSLVIQIIYH